MRYEIDDNNGFAIRIFNDGETIPFQFQPDYPDTSPFTSHAEAEAWAQASIAAHDPVVNVYAPNGPGVTGKFKVDPADASALSAVNDKLATLGLTPADLIVLAKQMKTLQ